VAERGRDPLPRDRGGRPRGRTERVPRDAEGREGGEDAGAAGGLAGYSAGVSRENVEVVRAWMRACNGTDPEPAFALCDPSFEMTETPALPGAATTSGLEALTRYFAGWRRNWSEWA